MGIKTILVNCMALFLQLFCSALSCQKPRKWLFQKYEFLVSTKKKNYGTWQLIMLMLSVFLHQVTSCHLCIFALQTSSELVSFCKNPHFLQVISVDRTLRGTGITVSQSVSQTAFHFGGNYLCQPIRIQVFVFFATKILSKCLSRISIIYFNIG